MGAISLSLDPKRFAAIHKGDLGEHESHELGTFPAYYKFTNKPNSLLGFEAHSEIRMQRKAPIDLFLFCGLID
jgi:hypothetical protein